MIDGLVAKLCPTLETPWTVARQAPLSIGLFQARILEWVAISFSRGSSQPRDQTRVSALQADPLPTELPGRPSMMVRGGKRRKTFDFLKLKGFLQSSLKHRTLIPSKS